MIFVKKGCFFAHMIKIRVIAQFKHDFMIMSVLQCAEKVPIKSSKLYEKSALKYVFFKDIIFQ